MTKIKEHAKNVLRLKTVEELLFWILLKKMEIIYSSAKVHQYNIPFRTWL